MPQTTDLIAAVIFGLALLHTFAAKLLERLSPRFPRHAGLFHLLGEVEVVFGFWAIVLVMTIAVVASGKEALEYAESRRYTEPLFVFVVMVIAASRPILQTVMAAVAWLARLAPVPTPLAVAWLGLAAVPLLGSLITEAAAITIAALMLAPHMFKPSIPKQLKYLALGVLFVNVSIAGTLTSYAAPPVLMVASTWQWDSAFVFSGLTPKALFYGALGLTAITDNAALTYLGSLINGMSDQAKYTLVAGAIAGGGLTVIANAPNPAGVALLKRGFSDGSIGAGGLLLGAAAPTIVAAAAFLLL